jgi:ribosomal subunit interface protein
VDITISTRRCTISDEVRDEVERALTEAIGKVKSRVIAAEVEFTAAQAGMTRCEITLRGKGPVIRGAGLAEEKMVAFDGALRKLDTQLRKAADRRKSRRGLRVADLGVVPVVAEPVAPAPKSVVLTSTVAGIEVAGDGPLVVREKDFQAAPLTLAQALDEMELVGHDFFLYVDAQTGRPSVVYHRKAYNYGVIHLEVTSA